MKWGSNGVKSVKIRSNSALLTPILFAFRKVDSLHKLSQKLYTHIGRRQRYVYHK